MAQIKIELYAADIPWFSSLKRERVWRDAMAVRQFKPMFKRRNCGHSVLRCIGLHSLPSMIKMTVSDQPLFSQTTLRRRK